MITGTTLTQETPFPFPGGAPDQLTRVGVRNHVLILPLDDLSNSACEAVANNVKGTLAIPHAYGRLQFGKILKSTSEH